MRFTEWNVLMKRDGTVVRRSRQEAALGSVMSPSGAWQASTPNWIGPIRKTRGAALDDLLAMLNRGSEEDR